MSSENQVFDRLVVRRHRDRAAARFRDHDFLFREVADRLATRLDEVNRRFDLAADIGCHDGSLSRRLATQESVGRIIGCDQSEAMLRRLGGAAVVADEEALPFAEARFDLVTSVLSLHWINDLPGTLVQIRRMLRPDGLFLAAMLGGETLHELRRAFLEAEAELEGGASPRISPFVDARVAGGLLQRAGFSLPVIDVDTISVSWPNAVALMRDLRGMGETNALSERRKGFTRRRTLFAAAERCQALFADGDRRIPATFQVVFLTAWAPHHRQQAPLKPGSAAARLADALQTDERSAGEKAKPKS